jgi:D-tyrosyl-tRNA(Tyr) deacylase
MLEMDGIDQELAATLAANCIQATRTDFVFISKHASASGTPALTVGRLGVA